MDSFAWKARSIPLRILPRIFNLKASLNEWRHHSVADVRVWFGDFCRPVQQMFDRPWVIAQAIVVLSL
jgi:hypothetical protein